MVPAAEGSTGMNIILVPYNWTRHVAVSFVVGSAALLVWWIALHVMVLSAPTLYEFGLLWYRSVEGPLLLSVVAATITGVSLLAEGDLHGRPVIWRVLMPLVAVILAFLLTLVGVVVVELLVPALAGVFVGDDIRRMFADPSTVTLRGRLLEWMVAGAMVGFSAALTRTVWWGLARFRERLPAFLGFPDEQPALPDFFAHLVGGVAAALLGAALWQLLAHQSPFAGFKSTDLYLPTALGLMVWGFSFGLFAWGVPHELYAGWIRVLSGHRYGHRVPIDSLDGGSVERIVGHFPRGLDVYVPADKGVAELHASFVSYPGGEYAVRGLSIASTTLKRPLENIDLSYEPSSPVPLETPLAMEDVLQLGEGEATTQVEFILLPKEER